MRSFILLSGLLLIISCKPSVENKAEEVEVPQQEVVQPKETKAETSAAQISVSADEMGEMTFDQMKFRLKKIDTDPKRKKMLSDFRAIREERKTTQDTAKLNSFNKQLNQLSVDLGKLDKESGRSMLAKEINRLKKERLSSK